MDTRILFPLIFSIGQSYRIHLHNRHTSHALKMINGDIPDNILRNKEMIYMESYSKLMNQISAGNVEKIYFGDKMKDVISLEKSKTPSLSIREKDPDISDYTRTLIAPVIAPQLSELSMRNGVETIFLRDPGSPIGINSVQALASKALDISLPLFLGIFVISIIRNLIMGFQNSPIGLMQQKPGFGEIIDPDDLKRANISLASFSGSPEILQECEEVVSFLRNESAYKTSGAEIPRGILLEGPPGTGKTLLAKSIAAECEANFISVASSEFVELFVGMGANKVRQLFENARENRPCIIFIDEIDAVGKKRGQGFSSNDEREQTLNQLLVEMDGFADNDGILVMGATNRKDVLDPALLRPGRFDRIITVPLPDLQSRISILESYAKNKRLEKGVDLKFVADLTNGFSGAQLKNIMNEAAIFSIRDKSQNGIITNVHIMNAIDKSLIGIIKQNDTRTIETLMRVAIHESGHAIMASLYPEYFNLKKTSIQASYSGVGGYTVFVENSNISEGGLYTRDILYKRLMIAMGGKAAESIYYGDDFVSLGAIQDLKTANELAQQMVGKYGMGEDLKVFYKEDGSAYSIETISKYDEETQELVQRAYSETKHLLGKRVNEINFLVNRLIAEKTVFAIDPYLQLP